MTSVRLRELTARAAVTVATAAAAASLLSGLAYRLGWQVGLVNVSGLLFVATALVGAALVRGNGRNRAGWVFLVAGTAVPLSNLFAALATAAYSYGLRLPGRPVFALLASAFAVLGVFLVGTLGVLWFPDGRAGGWRRRLLAVVCVAELTALMIWSELSTPFSGDAAVRNPIAPGGWIGHAVSALGISIVLVAPVTAVTTWALLRRAARAATPAARRGLRLAACAAAWVPVSFVICIVVSVAGLDPGTVTVIENSAGLMIGIAAWIGIRRYGLLDIRAVVSRALAYAALTALVVASYVGAAAVLTRLLHGRLPELAALAVASAVVLPLRDRIQQAVNRLLYGLRDEPATALVRLGLRLDAAGAPDEVLPAAARTVAEALRLSYVAILAGGEVLASAGTASGTGAVPVALPFGGETVGTLVFEAREGGSAPPVARDLLDALASHVAAAVRAVALNRALAASRESLVLAREEERRLMRRELHDGVGPTLAAVGLGLDAADRAVAAGQADQARHTLAELRAETRALLDTIRRIAYDLRPPILDELGLDAALREQAARFGAASATSPPELPALPAAVEVATYRIAVEAMANAARHAPGARVSMTLRVNGQVELDVADDGDGIGTGFTAGVGITSMRERAAELGGLLMIERQQPRGTRVRAVLPLRPPARPAPLPASGAAVPP